MTLQLKPVMLPTLNLNGTSFDGLKGNLIFLFVKMGQLFAIYKK